MRSYKGLLLLFLPLALLVGIAVLPRFRSGPPEPERRRPVPVVEERPAAYAAPPPRPEIAAPEDVARAMDIDRLRSTYDNYRTAMATGNRALADALRPPLLRERAQTLKIARETLAVSATDDDRRISRLTLESLER
jgi:hypothetical protein